MKGEINYNDDNFKGMNWDELDDTLSGAGLDDLMNLIQCAKVRFG